MLLSSLIALGVMIGYVFIKKPALTIKMYLAFLLFILLITNLGHLVHPYSESLYFYFKLINAILLWVAVAFLIYNIKDFISLLTPVQQESNIKEQAKEYDRILFSSQQKEAMFRTLVNNNPDMISLVNRELIIEFVNDAVCKFANMPREFFIGKKLEALGTSQIGELQYYESLNKCFQTGEIISFESSGWYDTSLFFQFVIIPLKDTDNNFKEVLSIIKDVTGQKQIERSQKKIIHELEVISEQLLFQNMQLQDFANITSHNLRSPVTNIIALVEMYENETDANQKQEIFDKLKTVAQRLTVTVNDLIATIKDRKNYKNNVELVYFEQQLQHVMTSIQAEILEKNAKVNYKFVVDKFNYPKIYIESIFLNLLTNAIKYKHPDRDPEILFETHKSGKYIVLTCQDNGMGIDLKKNGKKLFGLNNTFHTNKDAKGIGLYITKSQVESLGGSIIAKSELGVGTTFQISFLAD